MTATAPATQPVAGSTTVDVRTGLPIALCSAAAFALSGSLASSLLVTGWSPAAVVAARVGGAFLALLIPCLLLLRRVGLPTGRATGRMVVYGVVAVAGAQLCYFSAVQHLSVGVALLLEYLAPVLLIGFFWWRRGQRPTAAKLLGAALAMAGLVLVLDLTGDVRISLVGVAWGLGAALCLCVYFVLSESSSSSSPALLLTTVGTGVGAVVLVLAGVIGIVPLAVAAAPVTIAATTMPWWVPIVALALVSAALAYVTGIEAVRRLGSSIASFVALSEVILAVIFAALLLGQIPTPIQAVGGVLILAGIATVQAQPGTWRLARRSR
ncbi:MAG TPA: EamA family transporter [Microlunatus sp.]|nr:EamA family transporter [Microlunatus sp.]